MTTNDVIHHMFPDYDSWDIRLKALLDSKLQTLLAVGADEMAHQLGIAASWNVHNPESIKFLSNYTIRLAKQINGTTERTLRQIISDKIADGKTLREIRDDVQQALPDITRARAEMIARTETARAQEAGRHYQAQDAGAVRKVWSADAACCEFCAEVDGKTVDIESDFFSQGDQIKLDDDGPKMALDYEDVGYPPLHPNCGCTLTYDFADGTSETGDEGD
jgi:SPP1 gp7 family putative phage head morphogenesis protein